MDSKGPVLWLASGICCFDGEREIVELKKVEQLGVGGMAEVGEVFLICSRNSAS